MTTYKVLFRDSDAWVEFDGTVEAASAKGAIRAAWNGANGEGPPAGATLVAIPLRSWQPQPVKVETQQRLKIG